MVFFILRMWAGQCDQLGKTHKSILLRETFFRIFFWGGGGGGLHKNVSQILAIIDFLKQRNYWKNLVRKEEYYR